MAQHPHLALAGPELARRQLQERALPRPVRAQQARHARGQLRATGCSGRSPARTTSRPSGTRPRARSIGFAHLVVDPWIGFVGFGSRIADSSDGHPITRRYLHRSSQPVEPADAGRQDEHGGRRQPREHAGRPLPGIIGRRRRRARASGATRRARPRTPPRPAAGAAAAVLAEPGPAARPERPDAAGRGSRAGRPRRGSSPGPRPCRRRAGRRGSGSGSWCRRPAGTTRPARSPPGRPRPSS